MSKINSYKDTVYLEIPFNICSWKKLSTANSFASILIVPRAILHNQLSVKTRVIENMDSIVKI